MICIYYTVGVLVLEVVAVELGNLQGSATAQHPQMEVTFLFLSPPKLCYCHIKLVHHFVQFVSQDFQCSVFLCTIS